MLRAGQREHPGAPSEDASDLRKRPAHPQAEGFAGGGARRLEGGTVGTTELVERELAVLVGVGGDEAGTAVGEELRPGEATVAGLVDRLEGGLGARQPVFQAGAAGLAPPGDGATQRRLEPLERPIALLVALEVVAAGAGEGLGFL